MLSVVDALPADLSKALLAVNIRFVEQFLSMMRRPGRASALAERTGRTVEELEEIARDVEAEWPDLAVPGSTGQPYGMGVRPWQPTS